MSEIKFTDIPTSECDNVMPYVMTQGECRKNLAGTRCIVNYQGVMPTILVDLGCIEYNETEAEAYYNLNPSDWYYDYGSY